MPGLSRALRRQSEVSVGRCDCSPLEGPPWRCCWVPGSLTADCLFPTAFSVLHLPLAFGELCRQQRRLELWGLETQDSHIWPVSPLPTSVNTAGNLFTSLTFWLKHCPLSRS